MGNICHVLLMVAFALHLSLNKIPHISDLVLKAFGDVRYAGPQNLEVGLGIGNALRDRQNLSGDVCGCLWTESIADGRPVGIGRGKPPAIIAGASRARRVQRCKARNSPPWPGALSAAPGPGGDVKGPGAAWKGKGPSSCPAPDYKRSEIGGPRPSGPDTNRSPGALWIPAKGQRTRRKVGRKRSRRVRSRSSRHRKSRQRRPSIGSRHAGVHRARRCKSGAWQKRHMQRSTLIILSRRSKQRSVSKASERSRTASRATGVTSQEPTVEGTRGEPIGVAILSVARPYTSPNLAWARKTVVIGRLLDRAIRVLKRAAAEQQSTIGCRGPTAANL